MKDEVGRQEGDENLHPSPFTPALHVGASTHPSKVAWLSLDAGEATPPAFWLTSSRPCRPSLPDIGAGVLAALAIPPAAGHRGAPDALLNEIAAIPDDFILVLDDYHMIDARPVDDALAFLLEHQPPQMHLVIATREDPHLPWPAYAPAAN